MIKLTRYLRFALIVILALGAVTSAGCNTAINTADINSSYDAIKKAYADNPSNSEISFIYNAINNKITGYPKTVPDFVDLPIESIIDEVGTSERIHIEYTNDDNYENGIIIAQEPKKGAAWSDGVIVNLTVNRKYGDINSKWGYMGLSLGKLYLMSRDYGSYNGQGGAIWADGEKLVDGEMKRLYVDDGNVYFNERGGMNKLDSEGVSQVLGKNLFNNTVIYNNKIFYKDTEKDGNLYCYDMSDKTNSLVTNEPVMLFYVDSDYIIFHNPNDIFILDSKSYKEIKHIHFENGIAGCSLDNDNVYILEMIYINSLIQKHKITKYNIKQDEQKTIFETDALLHDILAVDDKLIFLHLEDNQFGIKYIDMRNMEEKYFNTDDYILDWDDSVNDILFDGQRIIYAKKDGTVYSISIFTGETKKIELIS